MSAPLPSAGGAVAGVEPAEPACAVGADDAALPPLPDGALAPEAPAPTLIRAMTWPTVTVSPSAARISVMVPSAGAGSSMSTLSVEISTTVSPSLTESPTLTDHSRMVPSVTDSPPVGVTMSTVLPAASWDAATPSASVAAPATASPAVAGGDSPDTGVVISGAAEPLGAATAAPSPSVEISARSAPTATVSPSAAWIRVTVPETGAGTSASTLSVEISTMVSSAETVSPSCLCHSRTVPSATESPMAGMTT